MLFTAVRSIQADIVMAEGDDADGESQPTPPAAVDNTDLNVKALKIFTIMTALYAIGKFFN